MIYEPFRAAVIGIDGAGKSSTVLRAIDLLVGEDLLCKPGRDPFVQQGAMRTMCVPRISQFFERTFRRVDALKLRAPIGASRLAFIAYQGWLERYLTRRFRPKLMLGTRCMILDPAIYSAIYSTSFQRMSLKRRLQAFRALSGLPFRDLYLFLRTPAEVAMDRIFRRIAQSPGYENQPREYWLHLHEQEPILRRLGEAFAGALSVAKELSPFEIVEVDTTHRGEIEVAQIIAEQVRQRVPAAHAQQAVVCA